MRTFILLLLLISLPAGFLNASPFGDVRIGYVRGDVQLYSSDADDWVPATVNTPLGDEDRIWVPEGGRAELQMRGGVYLRLDENSSLDLITLEEDDWQVYLGRGRMYVNNRQGGIDHLQVDTPRTSVSSYDNSIIILDTDGGGVLELSVLKGYSQVETDRGRTHLEAGRSLRVFENLTAETTPLPAPDSWERWNHRRDSKLATASESLRYLPDELDDNARDFDEYGSWHFNAEYGYVWRPQVSLSTGWAPYRDGRWVWRHGTYVWVSYEPWGWSPYHYGRWAFVRGIGWSWVPPPRHEAVWAPGYVAWVDHHDHIAWVPLAPGEAYYGHLHRRGSPPVAERHEGHRTYRNITINNSVTIVNRETFVTGRKSKVTLKENPFLLKEGRTTPPDIKPRRETASPVIRDIPVSRRPPERILRVMPKQIKEERKIRREENQNVLRPNKPAEELPVVIRPEPVRRPSEEKLELRREKMERQQEKLEQKQKGLEQQKISGPSQKRERPAEKRERLRNAPGSPPHNSKETSPAQPSPALTTPQERKVPPPPPVKPELDKEKRNKGEKHQRGQKDWGGPKDPLSQENPKQEVR
jgi:hypothetical protein